MSKVGIKQGEKMYFWVECEIFWPEVLQVWKKASTFALAKTKWEVLYGQLLMNPVGLDRSKGNR